MDEAIAPFREHLKQQNINEAQWINNLGRAHLILSQAPPEQKIQMFHRLAQDYGIQLNQGEMQKQQIANDLNESIDYHYRSSHPCAVGVMFGLMVH